MTICDLFHLFSAPFSASLTAPSIAAPRFTCKIDCLSHKNGRNKSSCLKHSVNRYHFVMAITPSRISLNYSLHLQYSLENPGMTPGL